VVGSVRYEGAEAARPTAPILEALGPALKGIVICPSNPWLSIDPILAVPGLRAALRTSGAPVIAVSPIVAGRALKGPAAKIMAELGLECSTRMIGRHYAGLIDALVIDCRDRALERDIGVPVVVTNTVMATRADKVALARQCLALCERLTNIAAVRRSCGAGAA
jgi:LPPG:FO 2-phospho-L-lactate transferase